MINYRQCWHLWFFPLNDDKFTSRQHYDKYFDINNFVIVKYTQNEEAFCKRKQSKNVFIKKRLMFFLNLISEVKAIS